MVKSYIFKPEFIEKNLKGKTLEPEVMAALFARFSRTDDGMAKILDDVSKLDFNDSEKMVERILKFIDYGHASIGGLTGAIGVGVDKISMLAPYLAFFNQAKQDGQETSTRYCEFKPEGLAHPSSLNVPERFHERYYEVMLEGFKISGLAFHELDKWVAADKSLAKIPLDASEKEAVRMTRNFGFDRARYTIPMAALTNFGLLMTAREWADTLKYLSTTPLSEIRTWARDVTKPLKDISPHTMKHSEPTEMSTEYMDNFFHKAAAYIRKNGVNTDYLSDEVYTEINLPTIPDYIDGHLGTIEEKINQSFKGKKNRYDIPKGFATKIDVKVVWNNMAIAEARDINRQRPCKKDTLLAPVGFYMAPEMEEAIKVLGITDDYKRMQDKRANLITELANSEAPQSYASMLFLGDQMPFEMHTDAAHMTYVMELRTGRGVHFRYDDHVRQAFNSFNKQLPEWTKHVQLGTGEPE